ncbi:hypothetical protein BDF19DRAFT_421150 [Syncephalis fuscata]|nr:hypothetical protein BDF19DRAFT_421150 [Syncephalis fuscata]
MYSESTSLGVPLPTFVTWPALKKENTDTSKLSWLRTWQHRSHASSASSSTTNKHKTKSSFGRHHPRSRSDTNKQVQYALVSTAPAATTIGNDNGGTTKVAVQAANYLATSPAYATLQLKGEGARLVEQTARDTETLRAIRKGDWSQLTTHDIDSLIQGLALSFPNGGCTYLTQITHTNIYMSPEEIGLVAQLLRTPICNVRKLTLRNISMSSNGARILAKSLKHNSTLQHLDLSENALTAHDIHRLYHKLGKIGRLQSLNLARNPIGAQGMAALLMQSHQKTHYFASFGHNTTKSKQIKQTGKGNLQYKTLSPISSLSFVMPLIRLDLRDTSLGPEGMKLLARLVATKRTLRWLNAASNQGGPAGAEAMAHVLADPTLKLARLSLELNDIGFDGGKAIARALLTNTSLTHLHMPRNNLGDQGTGAIANALTKNRSLRYLQLEFNSISDVGAQMLSNALRVNNTLRGLQLTFNLVGDEGYVGAEHLAAALTRNRALQHLSLVQNRGIKRDGHCHLANTLHTRNTTLKSIRLDFEFSEWIPVYEMVQASVARNFWQDRCRRKAAIELLVRSRIILSARPMNNAGSHGRVISDLPNEVKMTILGWTVNNLLEQSAIRRVIALAAAPFEQLHRRNVKLRRFSSIASHISVDIDDCSALPSSRVLKSPVIGTRKNSYKDTANSISTTHSDRIHFLQESLGVLYKSDAGHSASVNGNYSIVFGF